MKHDEMLKQLKQLRVGGKDLRVIKNKCWEQSAAVRVDNDTSSFQKIKRGGRQDCVLSPDRFNLYSEVIMRNLEEYPGIKVGGKNVNNLRYADDTVLIAENEKDLQALLDIIERESLKNGLELNGKKTEVMVISRKANATCNIYVKGTKLRQGETFRYLGTLITQDGRNGVEIIIITNSPSENNFPKAKTVPNQQQHNAQDKTESPSMLYPTDFDVRV